MDLKIVILSEISQKKLTYMWDKKLKATNEPVENSQTHNSLAVTRGKGQGRQMRVKGVSYMLTEEI